MENALKKHTINIIRILFYLSLFSVWTVIIGGASATPPPKKYINEKQGFLYSQWDGTVNSETSFGSFVLRPIETNDFSTGLFGEWQKIFTSATDKETLKSLARQALIGRESIDFSEWAKTYGEQYLWQLTERSVDYSTDFFVTALKNKAQESGFVHSIEVDYRSKLGRRKWQAGLNAFIPLYETDKNIWLTQLRAYAAEDSSKGGNTGLIYRFLVGEEYLVGANLFLDYENHGQHGDFWRWSAGIEAKSNFLDFSANLYQRISDERILSGAGANGQNLMVYSADGWDAEIGGRLPGMDWMEIAARYYKWKSVNEDDISGLVYRIGLIPNQHIHLGVEYDRPEKGSDEWGGYLSFNYNFHAPDSGIASSKESLNSIWERRYEGVRREYDQRILQEDYVVNGLRVQLQNLQVGDNVMELEEDSQALQMLMADSVASVYANILGTTALMFSGAEAASLTITAGAVILVKPSQQASIGLYRVATSVYMNGGTLVVSTRQAALSEIFTDGKIIITGQLSISNTVGGNSFSQHLAAAQAAQAAAKNLVPYQTGINEAIARITDGCEKQIGFNFTYNSTNSTVSTLPLVACLAFNTDINLTMEFLGIIRGVKLDFNAEFEHAARLGLAVAGGAVSVSSESVIPLGVIYIPAGPVPLYLTPQFEFSREVAIAGGFSGGFALSGRKRTGVRLEGFSWRSANEPSEVSSFVITPQAFANANGKIAIGPKLKLVPLVPPDIAALGNIDIGAYVSYKVYVSVGADFVKLTNRDCYWWNAAAGGRGDVGFRAAVDWGLFNFTAADANYSFLENEFGSFAPVCGGFVGSGSAISEGESTTIAITLSRAGLLQGKDIQISISGNADSSDYAVMVNTEQRSFLPATWRCEGLLCILNIPASQTQAQLVISALSDNNNESDETISFSITDGGNGNFAVTIRNQSVVIQSTLQANWLNLSASVVTGYIGPVGSLSASGGSGNYAYNLIFGAGNFAVGAAGVLSLTAIHNSAGNLTARVAVSDSGGNATPATAALTLAVVTTAVTGVVQDDFAFGGSGTPVLGTDGIWRDVVSITIAANYAVPLSLYQVSATAAGETFSYALISTDGRGYLAASIGITVYNDGRISLTIRLSLAQTAGVYIQAASNARTATLLLTVAMDTPPLTIALVNVSAVVTLGYTGPVGSVSASGGSGSYAYTLISGADNFVLWSGGLLSLTVAHTSTTTLSASIQVDDTDPNTAPVTAALTVIVSDSAASCSFFTGCAAIGFGGASTYTQWRQGITEQQVRGLINAGANVHERGLVGRTPLNLAAEYNSVAAVSLLLNAGASVNVADNRGQSPLHWAAEYNSVAAVSLLLNAGASVNVANNLGQTPLHQAAGDNSVAVVSLLLNAGASVNVTTIYSGTPLSWAAGSNSVAVVSLLLNAGASVNATNNNGFTPLHNAAYGNSVAVVSFLLSAGASVNATSNNGFTPLHRATDNNSVAVVSLLLNASASVNATTSHGFTPLHRAARNNSVAVVSILLSAGASVNATLISGDLTFGDSGDTPLDLANERNKTENATFLKQNGGRCNNHCNTGDTPLNPSLLFRDTDLFRNTDNPALPPPNNHLSYISDMPRFYPPPIRFNLVPTLPRGNA